MAWTIGTAEEHALAPVTPPLLPRPLALLGWLGGLGGFGAALAGVSGVAWYTLAGLGALWLLAGVRGRLAARPPRDGPSFSIASLAPGPVEVVGRVVPPKQALLSPLSSTKCSYFDYSIRLLDDESGEQTRVEERTRLSDFWLKDITGSVWVASEGLEIGVPPQLDEDLRHYDQTPRAVGERLAKLGVDPFVEPGVRRAVLIRETRLDPGDNMLLVGQARRDADGRLVIGKGQGPFRIERWTRPTFIAVVPTRARLLLWAGLIALVLGASGVAGLLG